LVNDNRNWNENGVLLRPVEKVKDINWDKWSTL